MSDRSSMSFSGGDFLPPEPSLSMYICIACGIIVKVSEVRLLNILQQMISITRPAISLCILH